MNKEQKTLHSHFLHTFKNERGLSILEVLIASTILAMIGIAVVNITNNSIDRKDKVLSEDKDVLQVEMAMSLLQSDFSQLYSPMLFSTKAKPKSIEIEAFSKYEGNERFPFATELEHPVPAYRNPDKQTFEFFTTSHRRRTSESKQSNYSWVRYNIRPTSKEKNEDDSEKDKREEKGTYELVRLSLADNPYAPEGPDITKVKSFIVLRYLSSFEFNFWDPKNKKFVESIKDAQDAQYSLRAIKVKFSWLDVNAAEIKEERVFYNSWPYFEEKTKPDQPPTTSRPQF